MMQYFCQNLKYQQTNQLLPALVFQSAHNTPELKCHWQIGESDLFRSDAIGVDVDETFVGAPDGLAFPPPETPSYCCAFTAVCADLRSHPHNRFKEGCRIPSVRLFHMKGFPWKPGKYCRTLCTAALHPLIVLLNRGFKRAYLCNRLQGKI